MEYQSKAIEVYCRITGMPPVMMDGETEYLLSELFELPICCAAVAERYFFINPDEDFRGFIGYCRQLEVKKYVRMAEQFGKHVPMRYHNKEFLVTLINLTLDSSVGVNEYPVDKGVPVKDGYVMNGNHRLTVNGKPVPVRKGEILLGDFRIKKGKWKYESKIRRDTF
jgi:hypothetical protein